MSAREQKPELVQPRAAEVFDEDIDLLKALQFAHEGASPDGTSAAPAAAWSKPADARPVSDGDVSLDWTDAETKRQERDDPGRAIERRLATLLEWRDLARLGEGEPLERPNLSEPEAEVGKEPARDSLITVPPAITSVSPPPLPRLPALPVARITPDRTVPLAPITPAFAATIATRTDRPAQRTTWAVLIATICVALPGGLFLGRALSSRPVAAHTSEPPTGAAAAVELPESHPRPETVASAAPAPAAATIPSPATSSARALSYPVDWSLVRAPRPIHHGRVVKPSPKPSAAAVSGDTPARSSGIEPGGPAGAPAPVDSMDAPPP